MGCRLTNEATPSLPLPESIVRDDVTNSRWEFGRQAVRGRTERRRSGRPFLEGTGVVLLHPHDSGSGTDTGAPEDGPPHPNRPVFLPWSTGTDLPPIRLTCEANLSANRYFGVGAARAPPSALLDATHARHRQATPPPLIFDSEGPTLV